MPECFPPETGGMCCSPAGTQARHDRIPTERRPARSGDVQGHASEMSGASQGHCGDVLVTHWSRVLGGPPTGGSISAERQIDAGT
jgi:hypothetical protein